MSVAANVMKERTKQFAMRVVRLCNSLPRTSAARVIGMQILRSATSVGANYRAACLARSRAEFISKISIVLEEADETTYWIELLIETQIVPERKLAELMREARALSAIFAASRKTAVEHQISGTVVDVAH